MLVACGLQVRAPEEFHYDGPLVFAGQRPCQRDRFSPAEPVAFRSLARPWKQQVSRGPCGLLVSGSGVNEIVGRGAQLMGSLSFAAPALLFADNVLVSCRQLEERDSFPGVLRV